MTLALMLAAWLSMPVQDDPEALYREALYLEVDRGDPAKAAETYARVLEAARDDSLRARASYRQAFCHEKLGRTEEAEQAYRQVLARWPGQKDVVQQAQARLAALTGGTPVSAPIESEIPRLILDLGGEKREAAIRRLVLIGDAALPEVRRALEHRDPVLSVGAARVLQGQDQFEGVYAVYRRALERDRLTSNDEVALAELLSARPQDRATFVEDAAVFSPDRVATIAGAVREPMREDRILEAIERRLEKSRPARGITIVTDNQIVRAWARGADAARMKSFVQRLTAPGRENLDALEALLDALDDLPDAKRLQPGSALLPWVIQPRAALHLLEAAGRDEDRNVTSLGARVIAWVGFDRMLREAVPGWLREEARAADARRLVSYYLGNWQDLSGVAASMLADEAIPPGAKALVEPLVRDEKLDASLERRVLEYYRARYMDAVTPRDPEVDAEAVRRLLSGDAVEPAQLDGFFDSMLDRGLAVHRAPVSRVAKMGDRAMARLIEAAKRALDRPGARDAGIRVLADQGQGLHLAHRLADLSASEHFEEAADSARAALAELPSDRRADVLTRLKPLFQSPDVRVRRILLASFSGMDDPVVHEVMTGAATSKDPSDRSGALYHWRSMLAKGGLDILRKMMKDPDESLATRAVFALSDVNDLEAVPELIQRLNSPSEDVRARARSSLNALKQHYAEQTEWKRWYRDLTGKEVDDK